MPTPAEFDAVTAWLRECRRPMLVSHRRPDADAVGSLAGLALVLQRWRQMPSVVIFDPFPDRQRSLERFSQWLIWDGARTALQGKVDALVVLDTCAFAQLEPIADYLPKAPRTLVIDHHVTRDEIGTRPGDLRLIDPGASATCLLVAEWLAATGEALDADIATALFAGIATDTGWFRFSNTDPRTMHAAASLIAGGAQPNRLYEEIYQRDPSAKVKLVGRAMANTEFLANGRLAVMRLRPADFQAAGADYSMTDEIVNEPQRVGEVEVVMLFTEDPNGQIRANLRSRHFIDVAAIARRYGGGGHARAAGARPQGAWDEIVPRMIADVTRML